MFLPLGKKTPTVEDSCMHLDSSSVVKVDIEGEWLSGRNMKTSECHSDNCKRH